jgi:hypothetical protein
MRVNASLLSESVGNFDLLNSRGSPVSLRRPQKLPHCRHLREPAVTTRIRLLLLWLFVAWLLPSAVSAQVRVVVGAGAGSPPIVRVLRIDGTEAASFAAYAPPFTGGVHVAQGDVNGDGIPDIITGAGPGGGPHVQVFSGADYSVLASFFAYDAAFSGGVFVAAGDVNGDGRADIITGAGPGGGPHVQVFSGADLSVLASFFAYDPAFPGGVFVAAGDVNGDGRADIITGAGPGGGPHVLVFSGANLSVLASFFAYHPAFPGGVFVAAGDVNADGRADIITGAGPGGGPHVLVFSGADLSVLQSFFAYDPAFAGGVRVGAFDLFGNGRSEIVTGAGPGGGPHVRVLEGPNLFERLGLFAFNPAFPGGVFVSSVADNGPLRFTSADRTGFLLGAPGSFIVTTVGGRGLRTLTASGLPPGVTFTDRGDGTGVLAGTPTSFSGLPHFLTLTVTPAAGPPVTQTFLLSVLVPPAIVSPNTATFTVGKPQGFSFSTTGSPPPFIDVIGRLPAGVGFRQDDFAPPQLRGTPAAGSAGRYPLTITAQNGVGSPATQDFVLTVEDGVTITSAASATFAVGAPASFSVTTLAIPAVTSIVRSGPLPAGVSFVYNGNGTATLSGTPGPGSNGTYPLTLTASNGATTTTQSFTLTINGPSGGAPTITSANTVTFVSGDFTSSFLITTTGWPTTTTITLAGGLPPGDPDHFIFLSFTNHGDGTASISGTPSFFTGIYPGTITASNGVGTATQSFTLIVVGSPATTFTSAPSAVFTVGASRTFRVTARGAATISVTGALPSGVTFTNLFDDRVLTGTPGAGSAGVYPLTFTATTSGGVSTTQSFTLIVQQAASITSAAGTTFTAGTAGAFTIATQGTPTPALSVAGSLPAGVTFTDNHDGTATLAGTAAVGTFPMTITATNGVGAPATQTFTLTVQ